MRGTLESILRAAYAAYEAGDLAAAEAACSEILRKAPRNADALHMLGSLRLRAGDGREACELYARLARLRPADDRVLEDLATAQLAMGALDAADETLRRALKVSPKARVSLHARLAYLLTARGHFDQAEAELRAALRIEPANVDLLLELGRALARRDCVSESRALLAQAADLDPERADASFNLALLMEREGRHEDAARAYGAITMRFPAYTDAYINLGVVCDLLGRNTDAIAAYERALDLEPDNVGALSNLAKVLTAIGRFGEAKAACRRALALKPDFVDAIVNHARALVGEGDTAGALREYVKAIELAPDAADVRLAYGVLNLGLGEFAKGWAGYAYRPTRQHAHLAGMAFERALPRALEGRAVLLRGEQGIGDELFFLRYSTELRARGARLHTQAHPMLAPLLERTALFESVCHVDRPLPAVDHVVLEGDLPALLDTTACPRPLALQPLEGRVRALRAHLSALGSAPFIGLTWRAGTSLEEQRGRVDRALSKEVPLDIIATALQFVPGTVVSLQRGIRAGEHERLQNLLGRQVHDFTYANRDLEEMLALLSVLDEYIGVSNTNMHLRAAVGRAARVLVPHPPEWRWMWGGPITPWFPDFRVYRESTGGGWAPALGELEADLRALYDGNKNSEQSVGPA